MIAKLTGRLDSTGDGEAVVGTARSTQGSRHAAEPPKAAGSGSHHTRFYVPVHLLYVLWPIIGRARSRCPTLSAPNYIPQCRTRPRGRRWTPPVVKP